MARKSFYAGFIEARERQAKRYVNRYLLSLDDDTLKSHGFDRATLIREGTATRGL